MPCHTTGYSSRLTTLVYACVRLCLGHDSSVTIVHPSGPEQPPQAIYNVRLPSLPFLSLCFTAESSLIGAGHDYDPIQLSGSASAGWSVGKSLDDPTTRAHNPSSGGAPRASAGGPGRLSGSAAFQTFRQADSRGISGAVAAGGVGAAVGASNVRGGERNTAHQNTITSLRAYEGQGSDDVTKISTSGLDGRVVVWNTGGLASGVAKMSL